MCHQCEYYDEPETRDPCDECLNVGGRENSHRPINFKEKKDGKNK